MCRLSSLFGGLSCELQVYGGFSLIGGDAADAEQGADGIEEPSRARRNRRMQAILQLEDDGSGFFFCRKAELFAMEEGIVPAAAKMEQGNGKTPAFSRGEVAACMEEGRKGGDPLKITRCSEHDFAAPDRSIRTVACAVETHADDGGEVIVLRHDGEHMRVVMLHLEDGNPQGFGEAARFVAWMKVGGDGGGGDGEQPLHARQGLAQSSEGAQIAHIAEIGRGIEE